VPDAARAGDCSQRFAIATSSLLLRRNAVAAPSADDAPALAWEQDYEAVQGPVSRVLDPSRSRSVVVSKKEVKDAPNIDTDGQELSQEDEAALFRHYGFDHEPLPTESGRRLARR
jgi:hypothetical protein